MESGLSELTILFCGRTPKQKIKEELDRSTRPGGAQPETNEEDKVRLTYLTT